MTAAKTGTIAAQLHRAELNFNNLVDVIVSDHLAASCQSIGQYRSMLIKFAAQIKTVSLAENTKGNV
ncbi:hypothetical protein [Janthinobacterium sp. OK676]|uniref:hypothetical protein n=1 Tax=Janthinobacterium sp. OK676 TaxID=1855295 RepID=UPI000B8A3BD3|nr:hypothetical protein [Janthinobacterium sp. OK676]